MQVPSQARVVSLWRFPFKSMLGEQMQSLELTTRGTALDRAFAFRDVVTQKKLTARQYAPLLAHQARIRDERVEVVRPDGRVMLADDPELLALLSDESGKKLQLARAFDERNPTGLFDDSPILLISMQSVGALSDSYPAGRFDMRRFRANIWVDCGDSSTRFPEQQWIGETLRIGASGLALKVDRVCERCVITTMAQEDLESDFGILRTITQENEAVLGVYCSIVSGGSVNVGDVMAVAKA